MRALIYWSLLISLLYVYLFQPLILFVLLSRTIIEFGEQVNRGILMIVQRSVDNIRERVHRMVNRRVYSNVVDDWLHHSLLSLIHRSFCSIDHGFIRIETHIYLF
ncbi:hypothetical protein FRC15_011598 [Serendipita sp. 397]|nr:hypothetical protein FRC15_011598 [Serendipita sp. 397]